MGRDVSEVHLVGVACVVGNLQRGFRSIGATAHVAGAQAVQERANRNAYPMTGMKSEDVREILSQINSLDRDE
jgi:hypothetical protein